MESFVIHPKDKSDADFLAALLQKLDMAYEIIPDRDVPTPYLDADTQRPLTKAELEDRLRLAEQAPKLSKRDFWEKIDAKWGR
jgi:hypothetical protein